MSYSFRKAPALLAFGLFLTLGNLSQADRAPQGDAAAQGQANRTLSGRVNYLDGWRFSLPGRWTSQDNGKSHYFRSLPHGFHVTSIVATPIRPDAQRGNLMPREKNTIYMARKGGHTYMLTSEKYIEDGRNVKLMHGHVGLFKENGVYKTLLFTTTVENSRQAQVFRNIVLSASNR